MKWFVVTICAIFVVTTYAADNSTESATTRGSNWEIEISGADYVVGYDEPSQSFTVYNSKLGVSISFHGTHGYFGVINATTGDLIAVHPLTGRAKLKTAANKKKLLEAFASKNNTEIFIESAKATGGNAILGIGNSTFNLYMCLVGLVTKYNNDEAASKHGSTALLEEVRKQFHQLRANMLTYMETFPFQTHNGVLLVLATTLDGPSIFRHDLAFLFSTIITHFKGKFNKALMDKVADLIEKGEEQKFNQTVFNSLSASISVVGPFTFGINNQVAAALKYTD